jgi:hypothetical protein
LQVSEQWLSRYGSPELGVRKWRFVIKHVTANYFTNNWRISAAWSIAKLDVAGCQQLEFGTENELKEHTSDT